MNAEHEAISFEVGKILASLDAMCAVGPMSPKNRRGPNKAAPEAVERGTSDNGISPWAGFASKTFHQLFSEKNPMLLADEVCRQIRGIPELHGRSSFLTFVVYCCGACALAAKSGSWRALAAAHRERGNAAAVFAATHEHLHLMALMRNKGSQNRGQANNELRAFVVKESCEKHSDKKANAAGTEISRRFDPSRKDLSLHDFGAPNVTFENTPNRFAAWILQHRKEAKSSSVA